MPRFFLSLIQDFGSVMVMDGEAHRRRKAMFLSLMTPGHSSISVTSRPNTGALGSTVGNLTTAFCSSMLRMRP